VSGQSPDPGDSRAAGTVEIERGTDQVVAGRAGRRERDVEVVHDLLCLRGIVALADQVPSLSQATCPEV